MSFAILGWTKAEIVFPEDLRELSIIFLHRSDNSKSQIGEFREFSDDRPNDAQWRFTEKEGMQ